MNSLQKKFLPYVSRWEQVFRRKTFTNGLDLHLPTLSWPGHRETMAVSPSKDSRPTYDMKVSEDLMKSRDHSKKKLARDCFQREANRSCSRPFSEMAGNIQGLAAPLRSSAVSPITGGSPRGPVLSPRQFLLGGRVSEEAAMFVSS